MAEPNITALARRLAEQNNVDWRGLEGTGPDGLVVEGDVLDYLARVMAGDEAIDPTPEPVPEGLESWPEQDTRGFVSDGGFAADGSTEPPHGEMGDDDHAGPHLEEAPVGAAEVVAADGWEPYVDDVLDEVAEAADTTVDGLMDGLVDDVVDDVASDVGAAWAAADEAVGDFDAEAVAGADALGPGALDPGALDPGVLDAGDLDSSDAGLSQDIFIFDDEGAQADEATVQADTGFDLLMPEQNESVGAADAVDGAADADDFDLDSRPLDGFGEEFTTAAERYWTGGDDLARQMSDDQPAAGEGDSLFATADEAAPAVHEEDALFATGDGGGSDDAVFGSTGEVTPDPVGQPVEEDPDLFDVRSFLNDDGSANADAYDPGEVARDAAHDAVNAVANDTVQETFSDRLSGATDRVGDKASAVGEGVADAAGAATDAVGDGLSDAREWAADQASAVGENVADAAETVSEGLSDAKEWAADQVAAAGDGLSDAREWAADQASAVGEHVADTAETVTEAAGDGLSDAKEWVADQASAVGEGLSDAKEWVADHAATVGEHVADAVGSATEAVGGGLTGAKEWVAEHASGAVESVSNFVSGAVDSVRDAVSSGADDAADAVDVSATDVSAPEVATPDVAEPAVVMPDVVTPDTVTPEAITPDTVTPDTVTRGAVTPDVVASDPSDLAARGLVASEAPALAAEPDVVPVVASPAAPAKPLTAAQGSSSAPFLRLGSVIRRRVDLTATVASLAAAGTELGSSGPLAPTPFLLRAAAKAAHDVGGLGGEVALAELGNDLWFRRVDDAATIPVRALVEELATSGSEEDELGLIVVDLSSFDVDELLLGTEHPTLSMGRILRDSETGASWCTLALSGSLPVEAGAALLARVAELLESPTRLLL